MMRFRARRFFGSRATGTGRAALRRCGQRFLLASAAAAALLPATTGAQDGGAAPPASSGVTFFTGPNFTGSSKTLTLAPEQPYAAIPFVGDELNEKIGSLRADPQVGAILFQRPYFASRDDNCGPNLGTAEDSDAWWRGLTADFEPPFAGDQAYETAEMQDGDYSSVIAYRREFGPPPGFLLLERRSYYNRSCERSADQSYFNRIFIPVPNPPQREACTELTAPASAQGAGPDAPRFTRVTDAVALYPEAFSRSYQGIDHRFVLTVFDGADCSGASITLTSRESGRPAQYRLSEFDFDRRARSVLIRYQRGPLDRYLEQEAAPAQATLTSEPATSEPATPEPATPAPATPAPAEPTPAPAEPVPAQAEPTPAQAEPAQAPAAPQASPPQADPAPAGSLQPQASPAPSGGGLQPAPPSAPAQQQALQPVPEPRVVPTEPAPQTPAPQVPARPTGPQEETFRFPVHQQYRLNFCLADEQGCGEPAANKWCEERGFNRASRWTREENIGALYPTVFVGDGAICDKFLCDGFEEITCVQ